MMPAMGIDIALKGAKSEDIEIVHKIFDEYQGKTYFDPVNGPGRVIPVDSLEVTDEYGLEFDLSKEGIIKIKADDREGIVFYEMSDRKTILEQLVLMCSGNRIQDLDFLDYIPIFERECRFRYFESTTDVFEANLTDFLNNTLNGQDPNSISIFFQITLGDLSDVVNSLSEHEGDCNIITQILDRDIDDERCFVAAFIAGV